MFEFYRIGSHNVAKNVGTCVATAEMKNGAGVILDEVNLEANLPADATEAESVNTFVMNVAITPEMDDNTEFMINVGDDVRGVILDNMQGQSVRFDSDVIATDYATINVGDFLVTQPAGNFAVDNTNYANYAISFEVIKKTTEGNAKELLRELK